MTKKYRTTFEEVCKKLAKEKSTEPRTLEEIYQVAGKEAYEIRLPGENVKDLIDLVASLVGEEKVVDFFSHPYDMFGGKTPYELCAEGKKGCDRLEVALMDAILAAHGG